MTNSTIYIIKAIWIVFMVLANTNFLAAQLYELPLTHFTNDDEIKPLPAAAVTSVFQDNEGYIWILNYGSGLVRYDGSKMEIFTERHGMSIQVFSITQDQKGRLWIGSVDKGIMVSTKFLGDYLPGDTITFSKEIQNINLPNYRITGSTQIMADTFGNIWTSNSEAILRYHYSNNDSLKVDTIAVPKHTYDGHLLFSFLQRSTGDILAMSKAPHMFLISLISGTMTHDSVTLESLSIGENKDVFHLLQTNDGMIWGVGLKGSVWSFNPNEPNNIRVHSSFSGKRVRSLMESKEGYILASTLGNGLIEWKGTQTENASYFTLRNGLLSTAIWHTMQDQEGNIWLATNSGLSRLPGDYHAFGHYSANSLGGSPNVLPEPGVMGILVDYEWENSIKTAIDQMVVATTASGISIIHKDETSAIITANEGLLSNTALDVHQDSKKRLWVLGREGLSCVSQSRQALDLPGLSYAVTHQLWNTTVYISTLPFAHFNEAKTIWLPKNKNDNSLVETTWFVGSQLILVLIDAQWFVFSKDTGLEARSMRDIAIDDQYKIYLADAGSGLWVSKFPMTVDKIWSLEAEYETNKDYSEFLNVKSATFDRKIIQYEKDTITDVVGVLWRDSLLWAATELGIAAYARDSAQPSIIFNDRNGLDVVAVAGIILNQDSTVLWAPSSDGLYGIDLRLKKVTNKVEQKDGLVSSVAWGHPSLGINDEGVLHFATNKGLSLYNPIFDQEDELAPVVKIRNFKFSEERNGNNELVVTYSALSFTNEGGIRYKIRLKGYDRDWSEETTSTSIRYTNLPAALWTKEYIFEVIAGDEYGNWLKEPTSFPFQVQPAWYKHWLAIIFYVITILGFILWFIKLRTDVLKKRQRHLESIVKKRTAEIVAEKERSDELLLNILPAETAKELKQYGTAKAKNYDMVTVLFTDFKEFTRHSEKLSPQELVEEIDYCFRAFDLIMEKYKIEKIKTVGDAYLAAAGLPTPNISNPADAIKAAIAIRDFMQEYKSIRKAEKREAFEIRIGVHTGPLVAGVVGIKKFAYDIWGDTVNLASRMESSGQVGKVNISQITYEHLKDNPDFRFISRGKIMAKNKGEIEMYFVEKTL